MKLLVRLFNRDGHGREAGQAAYVREGQANNRHSTLGAGESLRTPHGKLPACPG